MKNNKTHTHTQANRVTEEYLSRVLYNIKLFYTLLKY